MIRPYIILRDTKILRLLYNKARPLAPKDIAIRLIISLALVYEARRRLFRNPKLFPKNIQKITEISK